MNQEQEKDEAKKAKEEVHTDVCMSEGGCCDGGNCNSHDKEGGEEKEEGGCCGGGCCGA